MRRTLAALALAALLALSGAVIASANPGPGNSHQCAPGQHGGPNPPGACDNK